MARTLLLFLLLTLPALAEPAHTYSIVAYDRETGELGVAVQSHWFQVGPMVAWLRSGVGAVATQAMTERRYGYNGLELLEAGVDPEQALEWMLEEDPQRFKRQVLLVDVEGNTAAWTGERCIPVADHLQGDGFAVAANLMLNPGVCRAMAEAYQTTSGPLEERLMAALEAAEATGGDLRGAQSAALVVVQAESSGNDFTDRRLDLRVADHPTPIQELRRLLTLKQAYVAFNLGEDTLARGDLQAALGHYRRSRELAPDNQELRFWTAVSLYKTGEVEQALSLFRTALAAEPQWKEALRRFPGTGILDQAQVDRLFTILSR